MPRKAKPKRGTWVLSIDQPWFLKPTRFEHTHCKQEQSENPELQSRKQPRFPSRREAPGQHQEHSSGLLFSVTWEKAAWRPGLARQQAKVSTQGTNAASRPRACLTGRRGEAVPGCSEPQGPHPSFMACLHCKEARSLGPPFPASAGSSPSKPVKS